MGTGTASMHHAFGYAFVIKVRDLLAEDEILQQTGAACTRLEGILIVIDQHALIGGQIRITAHFRVLGEIRILVQGFAGSVFSHHILLEWVRWSGLGCRS